MAGPRHVVAHDLGREWSDVDCRAAVVAYGCLDHPRAIARPDANRYAIDADHELVYRNVARVGQVRVSARRARHGRVLCQTAGVTMLYTNEVGALTTSNGASATGQALLNPYASNVDPNADVYAMAAPSSPDPASIAAPPVVVPLNAYAPAAPQSTTAAAATPCGCNGTLSLPWWAWALIIIGAVAVVRRLT